jgi:hypothetical protein
VVVGVGRGMIGVDVVLSIGVVVVVASVDIGDLV